MWPRPLLWLLAMLLLAGCATTDPAPAALWPLQPVSVAGGPVRALQQLDARFLNRTEQFQAVIEIDGDRMSIVLLGMGGQRIATIVQQGSEPPQAELAIPLPIELPVRQIVETIQLIYFPLSALPPLPEWRVEEGDLERQLFFRENPYASIRYPGGDPWSGRAEYRNLAHDFSFTIDSVRLP